MATLTIPIPDDVLMSLLRSPAGLTANPDEFISSSAEFVQELRLAAAIRWYQLGRISHDMAAGVAGLSRIEFIDALAREKVDAFSVDLEELREELDRARLAHRQHLASDLPGSGGPAGHIAGAESARGGAGRGPG